MCVVIAAMRWLGVVALAMGCSAKDDAACPSAEFLDRIVGSDRQALVSASCKTDRWSAAVIGCMRDATTSDQLDACLQHLTTEQRAKLEQQFERAATTEVKAGRDRTFEHDMDSATFGRSPECGTYRRVIAETFAAAVACSSVGTLELYGTQQMVLLHVRKLASLGSDEQPAECSRATAELRGDASIHCR